MKFTLNIDKTCEEEITATVHAPSELTERIEALVREYMGQDKLPVYTEDEMKMLPMAQIECITVIDGKTWAIDTLGKRYRLKGRLYEVESLLPSNFIRINKSALANTAQLDRFAVCFTGAVDAVFQSGYREYVSRRCFADIKRRYDL